MSVPWDAKQRAAGVCVATSLTSLRSPRSVSVSAAPWTLQGHGRGTATPQQGWGPHRPLPMATAPHARIFIVTTAESACALKIPVTRGPRVMLAVPITVTVTSARRAVPSSPEVTFSSWLQQMFLLLHLFSHLFYCCCLVLGQSGLCELFPPGTWAGFSIYVSSISIYLCLCLFFTGF